MDKYRMYDVVVIGGGPAGLAAAIKCRRYGLRTLLIEASDRLGGIPLQCIHTGFGIHYFKEDLTGTEFIERLINIAFNEGVNYLTRTYVYSIDVISHDTKVIKLISPKGAFEVITKTIIYAAGARERHIFEIGVVGTRPAGIYTAGEVQALMDLHGYLPGREVVIIGSGDVGLIMARRFALEGVKVVAVIELMPWPGGLTRNVIQCLRDFNIPLLLSHAVTKVHGRWRVEGVTVVEVDENLRPVEGTERFIRCDTVVVAAGLVPNTDLLERLGVIMDPRTRGPVVNEFLETSISGVFAAGNALAINDLVDNVAEQGELAALGAKTFIDEGGIPASKWVRLRCGRNVRLVIPHLVSGERVVKLYIRVSRPKRNAVLRIPEIDKEIRLPKVMPAEMVTFLLPKSSEIRKLNELTIEVI